MFMGPWDQGGPWNPTGIGGVHRFLNRVWTLALDPHGTRAGRSDAGQLPAGEDAAAAEKAIRGAAHRTLAAVTADYEGFRFNTMVAKLMELTNLLFRYRGTEVAGGAGLGRGRPPAAADAGAGGAARHRGALVAAPRGGRRAVALDPRRGAGPTVDAAAAAVATRELPIQVNGKLRDRVEVPVGLSEAEVEALVLARPKVDRRARREDARPDHPRRRRPPGEHRRPGMSDGPEGSRCPRDRGARRLGRRDGPPRGCARSRRHRGRWPRAPTSRWSR